jgi:hypothetical protein
VNIAIANEVNPTVMMISDFDYETLLQRYKAPSPNNTFSILEEYAAAAFVHKATDKVIGYMRYEMADGRLHIHYLFLTEKGRDYGRNIVRFLSTIPDVHETRGVVISGDSLFLEKTGLIIDEKLAEAQ